MKAPRSVAISQLCNDGDTDAYLIESISVVVYQTTPASRILILLIHFDIETGMSETSSRGGATDTRTDNDHLFPRLSYRRHLDRASRSGQRD